MPKNDREVFEHLSSDPDTQPENDFLAYAIFASQKREWMTLFEKNTGHSPTQNDIDSWIANITELQFNSMRNEANDFFIAAAEIYFEERLKTARLDIERSAIVREVKAAGSFWKQLAIALITAILVPVILGCVIAFVLFSDKYGLSATGFTEWLNANTVQQPALPSAHTPAPGK